MNGELSDPLCDSVNRGLTLVRLVMAYYQQQMFSMLVPVLSFTWTLFYLEVKLGYGKLFWMSVFLAFCLSWINPFFSCLTSYPEHLAKPGQMHSLVKERNYRAVFLGGPRLGADIEPQSQSELYLYWYYVFYFSNWQDWYLFVVILYFYTLNTVLCYINV